jgi:long-subunit acyl-CoA synthetase (AMP-forming)
MIADPTHNQPMMIILPHPINMISFAKSKGIKNTDDMESLVQDPVLVDAVLAELNAVGKKAGCKGLELLEAVVLTADEWSVDFDEPVVGADTLSGRRRVVSSPLLRVRVTTDFGHY